MTTKGGHRRPHERWARTCVAIALLACPRVAAAQEPPAPSRPSRPSRTILVSHSAPSALAARLESEASLAGFRAVRRLANVGASITPAELAHEAQAEDARAVLRVQSEGVEVWLYDPAAPPGRRLSFVELVTAGDEGEAVVALRATEVARAAVFGERDATAKTAAEPGPAPPTDDAAPPRWHAAIGPGALFAAGQSSAMGILSAHLGYAPSPLVRIEISGFVPLGGATIEREEGNAALHVYQVATNVLVRPLPRSKNWLAPHVLGGASVVVFEAAGDVRPPLVARAGSAVGPAIFVGVGAIARITDHLALRGDATLGTTIAPLRVKFAERNTTEWGRPLASVTGAVEARF